jgi:hypothetical protein
MNSSAEDKLKLGLGGQMDGTRSYFGKKSWLYRRSEGGQVLAGD